MKRLFVLGCSFTRYHWPTWADVLALEYDYFENWGNSGLGNRAIVERLAELVVHNDLTKDDTIIVQWTDFHRFDVHIPHIRQLEGWFTGGSIHTNPYYSEQWKREYWREASYVMHTYNFIRLARGLLETLPCRWLMTSMNDLKTPLEEIPEVVGYENIFPNDKLCPPMQDFFKNGNYKELPFKHKSEGMFNKIVDVTDPHPSPIVHFDYLEKHIAPKLGITVNREWAKKAEDLLSTVDYHTEIKQMYIDNLDWDNGKDWVRGI